MRGVQLSLQRLRKRSWVSVGLPSIEAQFRKLLAAAITP